jgi:hypothetical protein
MRHPIPRAGGRAAVNPWNRFNRSSPPPEACYPWSEGTSNCVKHPDSEQSQYLSRNKNTVSNTFIIHTIYILSLSNYTYISHNT